MIIPIEIIQQYNILRPHFEKVKTIIDLTLIKFSSDNNFAYASRIKELDSLAEKIESGRYEEWNSIDDFIGAVIIVPNINYEPLILEFLETSFEKVELKKRGSSIKSPDVFRFDSTRFIGKLSVVDSLEIINTINFEIQIRSAFEHAWSVTTHDLAYKSDTIDWKVLRLASQLKSSVEQLDMIALSAYDIKNRIQEHKHPETESKIKICDFIDLMFVDKKIPDELKPKDLSRFSENIFSIIKRSINSHSTQWEKELNNIFSILEKNFYQLSLVGFPMSLSLYQLCFGILLKENILPEKNIKEIPFHKSELFFVIFPECKNKQIKEFSINPICNK